MTLLRADFAVALMLSVSMFQSGQRHGPPIPPPAPGEPIRNQADYPHPPPTLVEMFRTADLIIVGRVETVGTATADRTATRPTVYRDHTVLITEVLKPFERFDVNARIVVMQLGGTIDLDGREVSTNYPARLLEQDQNVVLFLSKDPRAGRVGFTVSWGQNGHILLRDSATAEIPLEVSKTPELRGRVSLPVRELLQTLRGLNPR